MRRALDESPRGRGTALYNLACHYALTGRPERALDLLRQSFGLRSDLAAYSRTDGDLASLRSHPVYAALTGTE